MKEIEAKALAKSKAVQPNAKTTPKLHHICLSPNRTTTTFTV